MSERRKRVLDSGPWAVHYFQRHRQDDPGRPVPAREFLAECPVEVRARLVAVIKAVAESPPPRFGGGLQWQAMHGDMKGWYEARDRHGTRLFRLFCFLERNGEAVGLGGPSLVLITGMEKPNEKAFSPADYARVRRLGEEYRSRTPRSVLR